MSTLTPEQTLSLAEAVQAVLSGECGYKAASKRYNVARTTIQRAVQSARARGEPKPTEPRQSRARTHVPARAKVEADPQATDLTIDPATCTRIEFLEHQCRRCEAMAAELEDEGNLRSAREWRALGLRARSELDAASEEHAVEEQRRKAAQVRDPVVLAAKVLPLAPRLARLLDPAEAIEHWRAMGVVLGQLEPDADTNGGEDDE